MMTLITSTNRKQRSLTLSKKLAFLCVTLFLFFIVLEVAARCYVAVRAPSSTIESKSTFNNASLFAPHPYCTYVANPEHPNHSPQGFRGSTEFDTSGRNLRIVCLGGSSTYGTRVAESHSFPSQLQMAMNETSEEGVEVVNAGVAGYSTFNIIPLLSYRITELQPEICVFYVGFNDMWNALHFAGLNADNSHAQKAWEAPDMKSQFWRYSVLVDKIADRLGYPSPRSPHVHTVCWHPMSGDPESNWRENNAPWFERNLVTLVSICRGHNIRPVVCLQATDFKGHPRGHDQIWEQAMQRARTVIRTVASELDVDVIDLDTPMSDHPEYFADCLHMNEEGNRVRGQIVAKYLQSNILSKTMVNVVSDELSSN